MWMRNACAYKVIGKPLKIEVLNEELAKAAFVGCSAMERSASGWAAPWAKHDEVLARAVPGGVVFALKTQNKLLPAGVVKEQLETKLLEIEVTEKRSLGRKERRDLAETITNELLPRAFTQSHIGYALLAQTPDSGWLWVDASTPKHADEFAAALMKAVPDLTLVRPRTQTGATTLMTQWLTTQETTDRFTLADDCELKSMQEDGAVVRISKMDLTAPEVKPHLDAGRRATKLALTWADRVSFVLVDDLCIKRLDFLDVLREDRASDDDAEALFDADWAIQCAEMSELTHDLMNALGGFAD